MNKFLIVMMTLSSISMRTYPSKSNGDYIKAVHFTYENQLEKDLSLLNQLDQRNSADLNYQAQQVRCKILNDKNEMYNTALKFRLWGGEEYLKPLKSEIAIVKAQIKETTGKAAHTIC